MRDMPYMGISLMEMVDKGPWSAEPAFADIVSRGPLGVQITLEGDFSDEVDSEDPEWMCQSAPTRNEYAKGLAKMMNLASTLDPNPCGYLLDGQYTELAPLEALPPGAIPLYRTPQHEPAKMCLIALADAAHRLMELSARTPEGAPVVPQTGDPLREFKQQLAQAQQFARHMTSPN